MFSRIWQQLFRAGLRMWPALLFSALPAMGQPTSTDESARAILPPESEGEWLRDRLDDASLWFASSDNLAFEPVAPELREYEGRRWVGVVDGRTAWVAYYLPGDIRSFEVDTHHLGAFATDFRFFAGSDFRALAPVDVQTELVELEARWLRLYHAKVRLPTGTRFLVIQFPDDIDRDKARLTEVWLQSDGREVAQRDEGIAPRNSPMPSSRRSHPEPTPAPMSDTSAPPTAIAPTVTSIETIQPFVVYAFRLRIPTIAKLEHTVHFDADMPPARIEELEVDEFDVTGLAEAIAQLSAAPVQPAPATEPESPPAEKSTPTPPRHRGPPSKA